MAFTSFCSDPDDLILLLMCPSTGKMLRGNLPTVVVLLLFGDLPWI
jgi:hypothetical protein